MKTLSKHPIQSLTACLLFAATAATQTTQALTPAETTSVLYMKQEEKVARDVYQALATRWDHVAFRNIAVSEQRHMDAIDRLMERHALTDTTPAEPGRFSIPELQKLHDDLVAQGSVSLVEALRVGVRIEEVDIADLKEALAVATDAMLQRVFGNLLRASGQHLGSFQAALGAAESGGAAASGTTSCPRGGTCAVAGGGPGRGRGNGNGRGNGGGPGHAGAGPSSGNCIQTGGATTCPKAETCPATGCPADGAGTGATGGNRGRSLRRGQR